MLTGKGGQQLAVTTSARVEQRHECSLASVIVMRTSMVMAMSFGQLSSSLHV